jgi:MFS family permease
VLGDRLPRRRLILATEVVLLLQALLLALLTWSEQINIGAILVLGILFGAASALEQPVRLAFVVDTVGKADLSNAVGLNSAVYTTSFIVGPLIGGVLLALPSVGAAGCFLLNGITFAAVIVALLAMRLPPTVRTRQTQKLAGSLQDGLRYMQQTPTIRDLLILVALSSLLTMHILTLLPAFEADEVRLGVLTTALAAGAALGALWVARLASGRRGGWLTLGNVAAPLALLGFCWLLSFEARLVLLFALGVGSALRNSLANSLLQISADDRYHARVMSIFALVFNGMPIAGAFAFGTLGDWVGMSAAVAVSAALAFCAAIVIIWRLPYLTRLA